MVVISGDVTHSAQGGNEAKDLKAGARILITGASDGVGSAAVQLAKRRGAEVIAVCGESKFDEVRHLGADMVIARGQSMRCRKKIVLAQQDFIEKRFSGKLAIKVR